MSTPDLRQIEKEFKEKRIPEVESTGRSIPREEWEYNIVPALRARAERSDTTPDQYREQLYQSWKVTDQLFYSLHCNYPHPEDNEKASGFWHHRSFDPFRAHDRTRGIAIDKDSLLGTAAHYLSHPTIQVDRVDWILLDSIVFTELEAYAHHVLASRAGTGVNWAFAFADHSATQYYALSVLFWVLGLLWNFAAAPVTAYYLYVGGHPSAALCVLALWVLYQGWRLVTYPIRWRIRRKARQLIQHLVDVYIILGDNTISPRKLKDTLDKAAAAGVVLDGAVFTVVDRIMARDPTAFIPPTREF